MDEEAGLLIHPWVVGELVLGGLSSKEEALLRMIPAAREVADHDLLGFIRHRRLARRGIGWVDCQLLACALTHSALLWSLDRDLEGVAEELKVNFSGFQ